MTQTLVLKAEDITFGYLNEIHGNLIGSKVWEVSNGHEIKTTRKVTTHKGGKVVKTNYLHIRSFNPKSKVSLFYREQKDGSFKQV